MKTGFWEAVASNLGFVMVFIFIVVLMFVVAYMFDKMAKKRNGSTERILSTRKIVVIGMFSAIAEILFLLDFPVPFLAPPFYKLDFSELPVLIAGFAYGPVAGVMVEFIKILLNFVVDGTDTMLVGEFANFVVGCSFILPATILYDFKKTKKNAFCSCIVGTLVLIVIGTCFNALYLLPAFSKLYGLPLDDIIAMGTAINGNIHNLTTFVIFAVAPINLVKGFFISLVTLLIYKKISPIIKEGHRQ